jgi:hypothetical protein
MNVSRPTLRCIPLLTLSLLLASCSHYYYMPNQHNIPLLRERGEVRIVAAKVNAGMITGPQNLPRATLNTLVNPTPGHDLQFASAVSKHIGLMANAAWFGTGTTEHGQRGGILELAPGYFHALGKHGVVEGYAGIGILRSNHFYGPEQYANAHFVRPFLQPIIGYASRNFDAALSTRVLWLHCTDRDYLGEEAMHALPDQIEVGGTRTLVEPTFMTRFGIRSIKLQLQFGFSLSAGKEFRRVEQTFGAGVQVNINNAFRPASGRSSKP